MCALFGFEEVCDKRYANRYEADKLGSDVTERCVQPPEQAGHESGRGEHLGEHLSDVGHFPLEPEGRIEEYGLEQVEQLDLYDVLSVGDALLEHLEQVVQYEIYEPLAEVGSVDVRQEAFQELH